MKPRSRFALAVIASTMLASHAHAADNLLFILDSSGSMWGQLEGKAKMETARVALSKLVGDLPQDTKVGLMAYGHRTGPKEPGACADIELLLPVGEATTGDVVSWLGRIKPKGKTPIAGSLRQSPLAFAGAEKSNNNIVLISDGIETCEGDPCKVAGELAASNINVRVHVVGFDISDKDRAQLECIAKLGKGKYFPANSTQGFTKAVTAAVKVAQAKPKPAPKPAPAPPAAKPELYFEDTFDGDALGGHWEVLNADAESYIVEDGFLNVITSKEQTLFDQSNALQNVFRLTKPMPKGDWTATMRVQPSAATFREMVSLALYTDKDKFLAASAWVGISRHKGNILVDLYGRKSAGGKKTDFSKRIYFSGKALGHRNLPDKASDYTALAAKDVKAILLRIRKAGRSYFVAGKVEGDHGTAGGTPPWVELDKLTSLRPPGTSLVVSLGQAKFNHRTKHIKGGETLMNVDWVKIETTK